MKKSTIEFIKRLLEIELDNEIVNENININEVNYVKDLISASQDFIKCYGDFTDIYYIDNKIKELIKK